MTSSDVSSCAGSLKRELSYEYVSPPWLYDNDDDTEKDEDKKGVRFNHSEIEKRRRDKMNSYIIELSTLIPMCKAMKRKLDKLTVLRMAVQHMKDIKGSTSSCSEVIHKPSLLSDDELKQVILKASHGFLFIVSCDQGKIIYVSETVRRVLQYAQSDLIGQCFFDIIHPKDIKIIKDHLTISDQRERLIDAKTLLPVKTQMPNKPTQLSVGARRSFFCQMKNNQNCSSGEQTADGEYECSKRQKTERKNYSVIHCTGYVKSFDTSKLEGLGEILGVSNTGNLNCLVAVGQPQPSYPIEMVTEINSDVPLRPVKFISRHTTDGKFTFVDQRAVSILGYLPQELIGTSMYEYYHLDDLPRLADMHKEVLKSDKPVLSPVYRFKSKEWSFVTLQTSAYGFRNPWTKEVESVVATHTVIINERKVSSTGIMTSLGLDEKVTSMAKSPTVITSHDWCDVKSTYPAASEVGRQISEEILERPNDHKTNTSDGTPSSTMIQKTNEEGELPQVLSTTAINPTYSNMIEESIMEPNQGLVESNTDRGDDAAMAMLMSLLEADDGLGGTVDFNDLSWQL